MINFKTEINNQEDIRESFRAIRTELINLRKSSETISGDVGSIVADTKEGLVYFEVYMRATLGIIYADLYDVTIGRSVPNSEVWTTSSSFVRVRTGKLFLTKNNEYRARAAASSGNAGEILGAVVLAI